MGTTPAACPLVCSRNSSSLQRASSQNRVRSASCNIGPMSAAALLRAYRDQQRRCMPSSALHYKSSLHRVSCVQLETSTSSSATPSPAPPSQGACASASSAISSSRSRGMACTHGKESHSVKMQCYSPHNGIHSGWAARTMCALGRAIQ